MQIILASAKIMREASRKTGLPYSEPRFADIAKAIAGELSRKTVEQLSELFGCSPEIGELNRSRYAIFGSDEAEIIPAIFAYFGQAYKHLRADDLSNDDLLWANSHLMISSCLYGILRPLDGINLYRMESGFPLHASGKLKVEDFWKPLLTDLLIDSVRADDGILIYLDTEEFRRLFDWKRVQAEIPTIVEPKFQIRKAGRLTTPSVWAKTCRGAMARYIILNRIRNIGDLRDFEYEGFRYSPDKDCEWLYIREM